MKIACNYYRETEELVDENKIDIDYFKFPALGFQMNIFDNGKEKEVDEFFSRLTSKKPVLLHGLYPAPHNPASPTFIKDFDFATVERLLRLTKTPGISIHPSREAIDPSVNSKELINIIKNNLKFIRQHYSYLDFVSVENLDGIRFGCLIDPEVINEIVYNTGCNFLLDISHAVCASRHLKEDVRDYISKLPLDRFYEIHINGWIIKDGNIMCHTKINEEGYSILTELLEKCSPEIITVEYGRPNDRIGAGIPLMSPDKINPEAKEEITEQVCKINQIISKYRISSM